MTDIAEPATGWTPQAFSDDLEAAERDLLSHLGAGVLATWDRLPRDIQKVIFDAAIETDRTAIAETRAELAGHRVEREQPGIDGRKEDALGAAAIT